MLEVRIDEHLTKRSNQASTSTDLGLEHYSEEDLLELLERIVVLLPASQLKDIDLEKELVLQYRQAKLLQQTIREDSSIPANQKAQVMNTVASTLQALVKMQTDFYTFERFKQIETALIRQLNQWPEEDTKEFFRRYEQDLL